MRGGHSHALASLLEESGAGRLLFPLADRHLQVALIAALPVWLGFGLGIGGPLRLPEGAPAWLAFLLLMPLLEELVFRGILQGQLLRILGPHGVFGVTAANALTTLAFAAAHSLSQPAPWALAVVVPSLVLGHLRERLHSTWPPVVVHAIYNAGFALAALAAG